MKRAITVVTVLLLCAGVAYLAVAGEPRGKMMEKGMMDSNNMMMHKPMMGKEMPPMLCPMHTMMAEHIMKKEIVAMPDGDVVVMAGDKLYKYDKDFNLIKEVELKAAADMKAKMEQMQKECMEKCQGMMMKEKGEKTGSM